MKNNETLQNDRPSCWCFSLFLRFIVGFYVWKPAITRPHLSRTEHSWVFVGWLEYSALQLPIPAPDNPMPLVYAWSTWTLGLLRAGASLWLPDMASGIVQAIPYDRDSYLACGCNMRIWCSLDSTQAEVLSTISSCPWTCLTTWTCLQTSYPVWDN